MKGDRYLHRRILGEVCEGARVLDIGAGMAKYHADLVRHAWVTMVDAHGPYMAERAQRYSERAIIVIEDALTWLPRTRTDTFDIALAIDFIEHLEVDDAIATIADLQRVARRVVLFIPEGTHPQTTDHHGMGGDHWQTHRSNWYATHPGLEGFTVERWPEFHAGTPGKDAGALWCVWRKP